MLSKPKREELSKQRQLISEELETLSKTPFKSLNPFYQQKTKDLRLALKSLQRGSPSQRLAGFGHGDPGKL